jgi:5-methylcytosine-specific restriction endonuclease McrBC GTP-binding regulatory subunit McrB
VQCTENEDYNKYMSIVLLDEMNLAHVEHYFADFLSKLETRRGTSKGSVPTVEVKLGAGVEPYQLKLERSVLWTGTMNQDETTKSLSDKVLDRGLVINFPRPRELKSRKTMGILDKAVESSKRPMLTKKEWAGWIVREVNLTGDQEKELNNYKSIVEDINNELEHVGRALGHRVWQSIEYYIINYPTVVEEMHKVAPGEMSTELSKAMKIAFEDQIVQKIMPKLRGVETRGKGKEYLEKIEALLEDKGFYNLKDDFETACEQGYGQFIWSSAKYIEEDEAARKALEEKSTDDSNE